MASIGSVFGQAAYKPWAPLSGLLCLALLVAQPLAELPYAVMDFACTVPMAFLVLAAQYESLTLPLAIILIVPMTLLSAMTGVWIYGGDNNIFTQIGLIVLVGLATKNAILIVEFAKELQDHGMKTMDAILEAARLRLRPILMTSIAFIMGVVPMVFSSGAGAEMRQAMGVAVFAGMIGVTIFGLILTPLFYYTLAKRRDRQLTQASATVNATKTEETHHA